jgi:thioredoxin 1
MAAEISTNAITEFVRQNPSFLRSYQASQANAAVVDKIREALPTGRLIVVAEYWCGDSRRLVPLMARIGDLLPGWSFEAYPWERSARVNELQVRSIPTFVVFRGDREIGRIVEYPRTGSLEEDLLLIARQQ